ETARTALPTGGALGLTGGDDLAVVLPSTGAAKARILLTDVAQPLTSVTLPGGAEVPIRLAVGLATHPTHGADADAVFMAADAALTEAVDQGTLLAVAL
ncbi:MAG: diguanylate cyclase domain-containing protein, partial [Actinomycetota bacterium]